MPFRFEFDVGTKILLGRFEGRLTLESANAFRDAIRKNAIATDALAGIWDLSKVTDFALTPASLRGLAELEPAMPDANMRPNFVVVPSAAGYGLMRMYQLSGEARHPLLRVVRTLKEALTALGAQSPAFQPLVEIDRPVL